MSLHLNVFSVLKDLEVEFGLCHHSELEENLLKINEELRQ